MPATMVRGDGSPRSTESCSSLSALATAAAERMAPTRSSTLAKSSYPMTPKAAGAAAGRAVAREAPSPGLATLADGRQELVVNQKGTVLGLDPSTGEKLWQCEGINDYVCPSVVAVNDIAFALVLYSLVHGAQDLPDIPVSQHGR